MRLDIQFMVRMELEAKAQRRSDASTGDDLRGYHPFYAPKRDHFIQRIFNLSRRHHQCSCTHSERNSYAKT